jgi:hypothetical protein
MSPREMGFFLESVEDVVFEFWNWIVELCMKTSQDKKEPVITIANASGKRVTITSTTMHLPTSSP